jgi:beta-xylosidase
MKGQKQFIVIGSCLNLFVKGLFLFFLLIGSLGNANAWVGMPTPRLHVEGRNLKDPHGNTVILHGFAQTYSPWFNEQGKYWTNYSVSTCLGYNKDKINKILAAGWKMNFIRLHMDPYWSNMPGVSTTGESDISAFSYLRFTTYLDQVFIPMAEYAVSKGLYVIMRPPGVCPDKIAVGDSYNQYLLKVWGYVTRHSKLKNNPAVMFELANEPINILGPDGTYGAGTQGHFDNLKTFFQSVVDTIRANGCQNILWVPGLGYQSLYKGYAVNPIVGSNIGYAVHIYPGWFGSGGGYANFQSGWDKDVKPVANIAPICVTEMDWAPAKYNSSWGKDSTGVAGGAGFGANFKKITDESKNVSWLLFTGPELLAKYSGVPPAAGDTFTFLNDPQACPTPVFSWYNNYAPVNVPRPDYTYQSFSDNNNGTYTNPVIFGDFPDPDVVRVGDIYYMVTTTMHNFPGATILKSYDLVNWEYCSNPLEKIESTPCYNLDGCNIYSHGQWASALNYKNGKFYLLFNTLDEGAYLLTATNPEGPWTQKKLNTGFYDPGILFDGDKTYVVSGINTLHIAEVDSSFVRIPGADKEVFNYTFRSGLEGSHLYKINGYYYIYSTYGGWPAFQVALRSTSIYGPYEERVVINNDNIHQGALIQTQAGEWWTMLFYDKGAYGRLSNLQPVTWTDNWPLVGVSGVGVTTYTKPNVGKTYPRTALPTNDNFCDYKIGKQWGWNHNPDNSKWSLIKRPGFLRMYTANVTDSLIRGRNMLTQRIMGYPSNSYNSYGTTKMHLTNMINGDVAGLCVFQDPNAYIGVKMMNGQKSLIMVNDGAEQIGPVLTDSVIYLRTLANYSTSKATFFYSLDNVTYTAFGTTLDMKYKLTIFVGNRFGLFNFATQAMGGYVDFDWFSTEKDFTENQFFDGSFKGYSEDALTLTELKTESTNLSLLTGSSKSFTLTAIYRDGHTEDATYSAIIDNTNPNAITVKNGQLLAKANGSATLTAHYQGVLGEPKTLQITVNSTYFPMMSGLLNPSIYGTGSYVESTKTLRTSQYGFGGWAYSSGIDLSAWKYLVLNLSTTQSAGAVLKLYDENNYWTTAAEYTVGSNLRTVVNLQTMVRNGTSTKVVPSHIYIIGLWSYGGSDIKLSSMYITNNSDFSPPTALEHVAVTFDENDLVDVYTLLGVRLRSKVVRKEATNGLPSGLYLVGRQKVMVADVR